MQSAELASNGEAKEEDDDDEEEEKEEVVSSKKKSKKSKKADAEDEVDADEQEDEFDPGWNTGGEWKGSEHRVGDLDGARKPGIGAERES